MTRLLTFLLLTSLTLFSKAQVFYQSGDFYDHYVMSHLTALKHSAKKMADKKIRSRTYTQETISNGSVPEKVNTIMEEFYSPEGLVTEKRILDKKGRVVSIHKFTVNEKNQLTAVSVFYPKQNKSQEFSFTYHNDTLLKSATMAWNRRSKKHLSEKKNYYNAEHRLEKVEYTFDSKIQQTHIYHYYPNGEKKSTQVFNKHGKVTHTWNYDCGLESSLLSQKQKDTLTLCKKEEQMPDGSTRTITETRDEKGKIVRKFNIVSADKKSYRTEFYNSKNKLVYYYQYNSLSDSVYTQEWKSFNNRGKIRFDVKEEHVSAPSALHHILYSYEKEKLIKIYRYGYSTYE